MSASEQVMKKAFGKRLRASRIAAGYDTGEDFAKELAVASPRYRKYERGQSLPGIEVMQRICDLVSKTSDFLFFGRTTKN